MAKISPYNRFTRKDYTFVIIPLITVLYICIKLLLNQQLEAGSNSKIVDIVSVFKHIFEARSLNGVHQEDSIVAYSLLRNWGLELLLIHILSLTTFLLIKRKIYAIAITPFVTLLRGDIQIDNMVSIANKAMYQAKAQGKGQIVHLS